MSNDSQGFVGIAPNATVWNLRAGNEQGIFSSVDTWEALESVFKDTGCEPYAAGRKKNKVVGVAFRMAVDKLGKFTTERDNRYGYGLPLADKVVRAMMCPREVLRLVRS